MKYEVVRVPYFEAIAEKMNKLDKNYNVTFLASEKTPSGTYSVLLKIESK